MCESMCVCVSVCVCKGEEDTYELLEKNAARTAAEVVVCVGVGVCVCVCVCLCVCVCTRVRFHKKTL